MLDLDYINDAIRDGFQNITDSHMRVVDSILENERAEKLQLIELCQTAIEGWHQCAEKNDKEFELALARLQEIREKTTA